MTDVKWDLVKELHFPARKNYPRRHVDIRDINETFSADLVEMIPYATENEGYKYILTVIDNFSKFAWAVGVKSKNATDVTKAMESILELGRVPRNLWVDNGKEFWNIKFKALLLKYNIHMYSTFTHIKAGICERFNRTLKRKMWMKFSYQGTYNWTKILPSLVENYNNSKHRTIRMKPVDVTEKHVKYLKQIYAQRSKVKYVEKFKVNDFVRISKYKQVFDKGYLPSFTNEIFQIVKVCNTNPITYKLQDYLKQPIEGGFYNEELIHVKHPDVYLVEKVLKKKGNKLFVKFLGFDDTHNMWINKSDL